MQSSDLCRFGALSLFPVRSWDSAVLLPPSATGHRSLSLIHCPSVLFPPARLHRVGAQEGWPVVEPAVVLARRPRTPCLGCGPPPEVTVLNPCLVMLLGGQYFSIDCC